MFKKRHSQNNVTETAVLTNGWAPELVTSLFKGSSERGLGFPRKDYTIVVDGLKLESNNFEYERKAYGFTRLHLGGATPYVDLPVVVYFVLQGDNAYQYFHDQITSDDVPLVRQVLLGVEKTRIYGKAILNAYGVANETPVFEWYLYIETREWSFVRDIFELSDSRSFPKISVRVGLPKRISKDSIVNDSMNDRLLIYGLWIDTIKVYTADSLNNNEAFKSDQEA